MSKQPPPAPTASAVGPCPTVIQIVGRPGTGSLSSTLFKLNQNELSRQLRRRSFDWCPSIKVLLEAKFMIQLASFKKFFDKHLLLAIKAMAEEIIS